MYKKQLNDNVELKRKVETETTKISQAFSKFQKNEENYKSMEEGYKRIEEKNNNSTRQLMLTKHQLKSVISTFINLIEFLIFNQSSEDSSESDEKHNMLKQIKSTLIDKLQGISKSISELALNCEISQVKSWKFNRQRYSFEQELRTSLANKTRNLTLETQEPSFATIKLKDDTSKDDEKKLQNEIMVLNDIEKATSYKIRRKKLHYGNCTL